MIVHEIPVPFHKHGDAVYDWTPGCKLEHESQYAGHIHGEASFRDEFDYVADAQGVMVINEIQRTPVTGFEDRVFFTRAWRDPDGGEFGKSKLRVMGARGFARLLKGWRHKYWLDGELVGEGR